MRSLFMSRLALGFAMIVENARRALKAIPAFYAELQKPSPQPLFETSRNLDFKFKYKPIVFSYNRVSQKKRRLYKRRLAK